MYNPPPFHPEPMESIRARFPEALREVTGWGKMLKLICERRGLPSPHVFDFESGLRMIVDRQQMLKGQVWLHVSFGSGLL